MDPQRLYTLASRFYDLGLRLNRYSAAVHEFVAAIPLPREGPIRVLDAGCGTGLYSLAVARAFPRARVSAFDLNEAMLARLREKTIRLGVATRVKTFEHDARRPVPGIPPGGLDLIVSGGLLEYVEPADALASLGPLLRKGGIYLNSPVKDGWPGRLVGALSGFRPLARSSLLAAFEAEGFRLVSEIELPRMYWPISAVKVGHVFEKV